MIKFPSLPVMVQQSSRRTALLGSTTAVLMSSMFGLSAAQAAGPVWVIYVAADDCGYCLEWERNKLPDWERHPYRRAVTFFRVQAPRVRSADDIQYWDERLHPAREYVLRQIAANDQRFATPMFIAWTNREIVYRAGNRSFENHILPVVHRMLQG